MQHTTPMVHSLESLDLDFLASVSGGCHKACCPAPQPVQNTNVINVPAQAPQAPVPQAAPPPQVIDAGPQVSTKVSINGQPA